VLHPYFKLECIRHQWGGPEEQAKQRAQGNLHAKDWQDEAQKIVERYVSLFISLSFSSDLYTLDGTVLGEKHINTYDTRGACTDHQLQEAGLAV
jgi:hypothetical protein